MYGLVIGLIILFSVLLVLVILAQNSKGGGLTSQFGGSAASNIIGVKKTGDLLEKLTWSFIAGIIVLCLASNFVHPNRAAGAGDSILEKAGNQAPATQQQPALDLQSTPSTDSAQ